MLRGSRSSDCEKPAPGGVQIAAEKFDHRQTVRRGGGLREDRRQCGECHDGVVELLQLELAQAEMFVDGVDVRAVTERSTVRLNRLGVTACFVERLTEHELRIPVTPG